VSLLEIPWYYKAGAAAIALVIAAGWGAAKMHSYDKSSIAAVEKELADYKTQSWLLTERMRDRKKVQDIINLQRKEQADASLKTALADAASANRGWVSLAASRANAGYLPKPGTLSADTAGATCINATNGERALEQLDGTGTSIAAERDACYITLNSLKAFAQSRKTLE